MLKLSQFACALAGAAILTLLAPTARADKIDEYLLKNASKVLQHCQEAGYKNLGVLKFEVQVGKNPPSMRVGRLNAMMATKLENALIGMLKPTKDPLGITRGATAHAVQKDARATFATAEGRARLFTHTYLRAWGVPLPKANPNDVQLYEDKFISVDAFATGLVKVNYSTLKTTVRIWMFDRKNPAEVREVVVFDAPLDRQLLADLNVAVTVVRRDADAVGIVIDPDKIAEPVKEQPPKNQPIVVEPEPKPIVEPEPKPGPISEPKIEQLKLEPLQPDPKTPPQIQGAVEVPLPGGPSARFEDLLEFTVYYDGKPVKWSMVGGQGKLFPPLPGQTIHFTVKATKKIGMVLRVNGVSTWGYLRDRDLRELPLWVLEPGQEYTIEGFYPSPDKVLPFRAVPAAAMDPGMAGSAKLGYLDIDLFFDTRDTPDVKIPAATGRSANLRTTTARTRTLEELQGKLVKVTKKEFLDADPSRAGGANVQIVQFIRGLPGPRLTIQYEVADKGGLIPE